MEKIKIRIDLYKCKKCGHVYKDRELAKNCEDYCKKHNKCNVKITKHGIPLNKSYSDK